MKRSYLPIKGARQWLAGGLLIFALVLSGACSAETHKSKLRAVPSPPAPIVTQPLILMPSDTWEDKMVVDAATLQSQNSASVTADDTSGVRRAKKKLNVGCDVDLRPQSIDDNRLANRVVGECRLGYNY